MRESNGPQNSTSLLEARYAALLAETGHLVMPEEQAPLNDSVTEVLRMTTQLREAPTGYTDPPYWPVPVSPASPSSPRAPLPKGPHPPPAFSSSRLAFAPVWQLAAWLRDKAITPIELTEFFLSRLQRYGPDLHAVTVFLADRAHNLAQRATNDLQDGHDSSPLLGIPYGAKDLLAVAGAPTTWGAEPLRRQWLSEDADVIQRLDSAGAVLLAKLAMVELAGGAGYDRPEASWSGPGVNPWDTKHWSGGSSSGTASAVSAGLLPWGIGTETWGSILGPSAFCGLSGLRPSFGRINSDGAMVLSWTLDKIGPMCRDAWDCGLTLEAMTAPLPDKSTAKPWLFQPQPHRPFRLATVAYATDGALPQIARHFETALHLLSPSGTLGEIPLPDLPVMECTQIILRAEMAAAFEQFYLSGLPRHLTAPEDRYRGYANFTISAREYLQALRIRGKLQRWYTDHLASLDAILFPTLPGEPPVLGRRFSDQAHHRTAKPARAAQILQALGCLLGLPAIT
ncbi:MAG: amidase, partial [Chloroflexi bacterium]|nr:amidase [Chloroflexota bacterium]